MPWHVIVRTDTQTLIRTPQGEPILDVSLTSGGLGTVSSNLAQQLAAISVTPHPRAVEFLLMAMGAFQADARISRREADDRWTRHYVLHLPVADPRAWEAAAPNVERALRFLTGDIWQLQPYHGAPNIAVRREEPEVGPRRVALFSGGMDSFLGAVRLVQDQVPTLLLGHHASSNGTLADQRRAWGELVQWAGAHQARFVEVLLAKRKGVAGPASRSELTTRSRSIIFLALGILFASSEAAHGTLVIPENGFVSLNVPLTNSRLGSLSTRTTHPYFTRLLRTSLRALGVDVDLELPFRFHTKGMLLLEAPDEVREMARRATVSCAHPVNQRVRRGPGYKRHCGYCYPCLIRRSALSVVGLDDPDDYRVDVFQLTHSDKLSTLQAMRAAVRDHARLSSPALRVLNSGPLDADHSRYLEVWERGIAELTEWLG